MKFKIFVDDDGHNNEPKLKFCIFPRVVIKSTLPHEYYIVWWEWVEWSNIYNSWLVINKPKKNYLND